jgi:hypothetical protein
VIVCTDLDPDYDDDGSEKYATEEERFAGWAEANHAEPVT